MFQPSIHATPGHLCTPETGRDYSHPNEGAQHLPLGSGSRTHGMTLQLVTPQMDVPEIGFLGRNLSATIAKRYCLIIIPPASFYRSFATQDYRQWVGRTFPKRHNACCRMGSAQRRPQWSN